MSGRLQYATASLQQVVLQLRTGGVWTCFSSKHAISTVTEPARGHHVVPPSWGGHVPAIHSESVSQLMAGTRPAMTVGGRRCTAIFAGVHTEAPYRSCVCLACNDDVMCG